MSGSDASGSVGSVEFVLAVASATALRAGARRHRYLEWVRRRRAGEGLEYVARVAGGGRELLLVLAEGGTGVGCGLLVEDLVLGTAYEIGPGAELELLLSSVRSQLRSADAADGVAVSDWVTRRVGEVPEQYVRLLSDWLGYDLLEAVKL